MEMRHESHPVWQSARNKEKMYKRTMEMSHKNVIIEAFVKGHPRKVTQNKNREMVQ